ncbi:hypothetical protein COY87_04920 [Candidatus Roizmanbacteria bacterium CG_4_10_14_0_8_um_filter_33_9]|uniref:HAD family hydrolase n=1 Tax=Candidatus Roizmanbacteria bacterium CG_4_10_14_0_8_um_filter_33_9 TaxID=1974826 RepID=A0A2M7QIH1_9BACT|nr:MAG: hypothetical protein COY87_04920 [Candidatus Roizmanbacteria bacterium CG_4_10_14_0_8_um_filter_33_9]
MQPILNYLKTNHKSHLIFDLDSTLIKLLIDWSTYREQLWKLVSTFDNKLTEEIPCKPFMGFKLTNTVIKKHGEKAKQILDQFNEHYELTHYTGYLPNANLISFIHSYYQQYHFFLWTNNAKKTIKDVMQKENFTTCFQKVITRDDVYYIKPEIDGFKLIHTNNNLKNGYLLIGDSIFDKQAADTIGIDFFRVNYFTAS